MRHDLVAGYSHVWDCAVRPNLGLALNILSIPFWIASAAVYVMLGRPRSPRLAWIGGSLVMGGMAALAANLGTEVMTSALVAGHVITPEEAASATMALDTLPATAYNLLFLVGVGLGIPLTGVSLWRSHVVPRAAAGLLVAFLAIDLLGQATRLAALPVAGHLVAAAAALWIAVGVLRAASTDAMRQAAGPMGG